MAGDWLKLHRTLLDSEQMADDWLCRLFIWCLLRANYAASTFRGQTIHPGQFVTGRISAAAELKVSPSKWYRGIERLAAMGCVTAEANSNWTTLTISNWTTYQEDAKPERTASGQRANSQRTAGDTTGGQRADTIEEGKKGRREEGKKKDASLSVVIPESLQSEKFLTAWSQWQQFRREIKCPLTETQAAKQMEQFVTLGAARSVAMIDHTISKGWRGLRESEDVAKPVPPKRTGPRPLTTEEMKHWVPRQTADEDE